MEFRRIQQYDDIRMTISWTSEVKVVKAMNAL
jgi:hypothetical protein